MENFLKILEKLDIAKHFNIEVLEVIESRLRFKPFILQLKVCPSIAWVCFKGRHCCNEREIVWRYEEHNNEICEVLVLCPQGISMRRYVDEALNKKGSTTCWVDSHFERVVKTLIAQGQIALLAELEAKLPSLLTARQRFYIKQLSAK